MPMLPALATRRAAALREAEALRTPQNTFRDPEQFDRLMAEIDAIDAVAAGTATPEQRTRALDILADDSERTPTHSAIRMGDDLTDAGARQAISPMAEALAHRLGARGTLSEAARPYRGLTLVGMARQLLIARGDSQARHASDGWIATRIIGHGTGDFPALLTETGDRLLRQAYEAADPGIRRIARQTTARDFRAVSRLALSEHPALLEVNQHGEVTRGGMAEQKESYSLKTFARIFALTRQAIINDDLGAFADFTRRQAGAAVELIASQLTAKLTSNPTMSDNLALFHATHGNLATPGAIDLTALGEMLKLLRTQTGIATPHAPGAPLNLQPKYLLVPAALEVKARQYAQQINAVEAAEVNPFGGQLEVVVDPRLDVVDDDAWYLTTDPDIQHALEYAYLEDAPGPQYDTRAGFDVMGIEMRVALDFGCGAVDWRGIIKNAGGS